MVALNSSETFSHTLIHNNPIGYLRRRYPSEAFQTPISLFVRRSTQLIRLHYHSD